MINDRQLRRVERQIWELLAWRNHATSPLEPWLATGRNGEQRELQIGDRWDDLGPPVRLSHTLDGPAPTGSIFELEAEGDGLVFLDGMLAAAISPFERQLELNGAREIVVELAPNDSFGLVGTSARLLLARIVQPDHLMRQLFRALLLAWETCASRTEHDLTPLLLDAIEQSLAMVDLPSEAEFVLERTRLLRYELELELEVAKSLDRHYHYSSPRNAIERLLGETGQIEHIKQDVNHAQLVHRPAGARSALDLFNKRVTELAQRFPPTGGLAATSHAHLDVAWLWPLEETRRKIRHTVANVLTLMERYPDFHFTASSAQLYAYVQQDDPELFERVRARVKEGRWEPIGGMWLEPDCNLPSGESLGRHLLYGQQYFEREFGIRSTVAWLPDTFGLAGSLPQILAGGGLTSFFTQKLSWNDTNQFPHDLWLWEGIDGTRVLAHSFDNPVGGYNGQITPDALTATWRNFRGKSRHSESLYAFGMGNGGRGPTSEMLERLQLLNGYPALPKVRQATVEEFFSGIRSDDLPVWSGELYFEFHRGTYTTQSRIKRLNRMAEHRLQEAETASTMASLAGKDYPRQELDHSWTTLLRNQFHDILPGSSIRQVNEQADSELKEVVEKAIDIRDRALACLGTIAPAKSDTKATSVRVFNARGFDRPLSGIIPRPIPNNDFRLTTADGHEVSWQLTSVGDVLIHDPNLTVPGTGYVDLDVAAEASSEIAPVVSTAGLTIENEHLRVSISEDGSITSLFDKRTARETLTGPGNQLRIYHDLPAAWEAWNLTDTTHIPGEPVSEIESLAVIESGPLRVVIEVHLRYGASTIRQRYQLVAGSARLDIRTEIDWNERRKLLRALFPVAVRSPLATFETSFGAVQRPTYRNTTWDTARFEVPAHRWADLSEPGYGVSLLNDGRYGHSAFENTLGISLLRSPLEPDPLADLGQHEFTYSVFPHLGEWHTGETLAEAINLNSPLIGTTIDGISTVPTKESNRLFEIDGLTLAAVKQAEDTTDDVVLRLYDPFGRHGSARIKPYFAVNRAVLANLLEDELERLDPDSDGSIHLNYRPFQILTLKLTRA